MSTRTGTKRVQQWLDRATVQDRASVQKATWTTSDLVSTGGYLQPEQATEFLRIAIDESVIVREARNEFSNSPVIEVPRMSMASRVLRPGTEGQRLQESDRVKPSTGLVEIPTVLVKGEIPVSDELFEDNIERDRVADTIMAMGAEAVGRDVEELLIKGDTARTGGEDAYLDLTSGIIKLLQTNLAAGQKVDATAQTTYVGLWASALEALPSRYRRNYNDLRLYIPITHRDKYLGSLADRGTDWADTVLNEGVQRLAFRSVPLTEVPLLSGTDTINGGAVDYSNFAFLIDPKNLVVGWHRRIKVEKFRDPREGATSFVITARVGFGVADPGLGVLIYNIPTDLT
jgi:hypothetical protein